MQPTNEFQINTKCITKSLAADRRPTVQPEYNNSNRKIVPDNADTRKKYAATITKRIQQQKNKLEKDERK